MKLSKKTVTALSFTIGACVFVSTAFADALLGSGYDRLKSSVKMTASQMEAGLGSYKLESLMTIKSNGQEVLQTSSFKKIDMNMKASEESTVTQYAGGQTTSYYSYSDTKRSVWKNDKDAQYYVTEFPEGQYRGKREMFTNPFNEKEAPEIEKIVDAVVGNLKDYVQAEERADGGKVYAGSLSEAQVPAIVNAVSSFGLKQMLRDQARSSQDAKLPAIESDIFVKKVTGTAIENKAGLLESMTGEIIVSGKDKDGVQHDLSAGIVFKLSDVGKTTVAAPDLTGAKVEKVSQTNGFGSKHVGTYVNNIVMEKDGQFVKIGERKLEITSVDENKVAGKYSETVKPGYESEYGKPYSFDFEYNPDQTKSMPLFTYTNDKGEQANGQLHPGSNGKVYLNLDIEVVDENSYRSSSSQYFDGEFTRIFAE
ncbi:hypothetical protein SAMN02799630_00667 [Paenibacillus sp. UNCCL117]|uniref:hypothetical protein n=1 Tax=unclassified Paenibacillus TaxID=185978 RepID=UPI00088A3550|nr:MULTISPECIES: hypothetical protein [unclassified Paenibacillus]SDC15443.1 hypothetical protein SAMN04488602_101466 [Paenibacillus sp. cl123]SFW17552.1 hypothetical protein SAMN02799630_00667 [Paenibacillus sp. UNCCL117]